MALWTMLPEQGAKDARHAHVVQVANGAQHALMLTDEGIVYSWGGKNEHGQLGRTGNKNPSPVTENIRDEIIVQVSCGLNHSLVLSQRGALFAWGYNKAGQVGVEGFRQSTDSGVRKPAPVKGFNGKDNSRLAKSCSCGPESSACVTTEGEIYVWGAVSYYLFNQGKSYDPGDNFTVPVKIRGVPEVCRPLSSHDQVFIPDRIALYKDQFACTIAQKRLKDDLMDIIKSLKQRSTQLANVIKSVSLENQASTRVGDGQDESEELGKLTADLRKRKKDLDEQIRAIKREQARCKNELQRIGRELTICDQQDTALADFASSLEVKRSEAPAVGGDSLDKQDKHRALDTQLKDIDHFKDSNQRSKLQSFEQREVLERENLRLTQELTQATQEKQQVEGQEKLIRSLRQGDFGSKDNNSVDDGLKIAVSKCMELAATDPQTLAGQGRFAGFREVLAIAERALQDISSALKEVSSASSSGDGVLEGVLEINLKLRKECIEHIKQKLELAENGTHGMSRPDPGAWERPPSGQKDESFMGMVGFFEEVSQHPKGTSRLEPQSAQQHGVTGFFGLPASGNFWSLK